MRWIMIGTRPGISSWFRDRFFEGRRPEWPAPGAPALAEKPPLGEPRPAVTYEITGRVHEALRQFMVEHRKPITAQRHLYATFWELQNAIEVDMPELLEDDAEEAP